MATASRARMIRTVERLVGEAAGLGLVMNQAGSANGAECIVNGVELKNFGSSHFVSFVFLAVST